MAYETLIVDVEDHICLIKLNRPDALNALNAQLLEELSHALTSAQENDKVRAIVLTGSEKAFAAGADVTEMAGKSFTDVMAENLFAKDDRSIRAVRKPIIAAVAGYALGGGCELAMVCDFIIAAMKIDLEASGLKGGKWVQCLKEAFQKGESQKAIIIDGVEYRAHEFFHLLHIQKGDSLGIIMDHAATEENHSKIYHHFLGCQKVFIESFYKNDDQKSAELNSHSYAGKSGFIMRKAKVREAIPVHFSRKYTETETLELVSEFEAAFRA